MATPKDDYVFTRDILDNSRLNLMHKHWVKDFGYLLHPKIPTEGKNLRIADIGCGTSIWLLDVCDRLPKSTQFDGLDISFDASPPQDVIPSNITFRKWNVKEPVPEDLIGAFDVVHLRFFIYVLLKEEVPDAVSKFVQMLKPGGYLQWVDSDNESIRVKRSKPENRTESLEQLFGLLKSQDPRFNPTWVPQIPKFFLDCGLQDVEAEIHDSPPHLAWLMHECGLVMHELIARKTQNKEMAEKVQRLLPAAVTIPPITSVSLTS
ncbi:UMTA methyltransferase family protein [Hypoxylon sp. FL1284]|nr:UMTA methyltransferase family protein [Hypoxylon sp. FL1284]